MFNKEQLKSEALRRFMMEVPAGQKLFEQNDKGNTLYIIVDGSIKLMHKVMQAERVIAILGPGEIVGEKALCSATPYRRAFSAIADSDTTVLEFDGTSLKAIASKLPDFPLKMLEVVVQRLDKANELVAILQIPQPAERVVQYLLYISRYFGKKSATGTEFSMNADEACSTLNLPASTIQEVVTELLAEKILTPREKGYLLADDNALIQHLPALRERIAA
jgi:CRP/FNR family transcriptional regulator, cyclic AMP receptor protein